MSATSTPTVGPLDPIDATPLPLQPGELVAGRYEVLRLLGSGGSAFVYAVRDRKIGDEIALKLLRNAARSEIDVERTRREAEFARGPGSPRLVRTFDLVETDGLVFLTMELVPGGSLRDLLRRGPLPVDETVRLAGEILEALQDLHALGIVHRDLKPGNLLLTADGHLKLSDFGIARRWTDEDARLTRTGLPVGTVDYLSPEQAAAEAVDPRSDLYAFGVVLYEMLTGRVPFAASSAVGSIVMWLHRRPEDVRRLRPDVPRWLAALVARLLERKHEDRYASAQAVLDDFHRKRVRDRRLRLRLAIEVVVLFVVLLAAWSRSWGADLRLVADGDTGLRAINVNGETLWTRADTHPPHAAVVHRGGVQEVAAVLSSGGVAQRVLTFLDPLTGRVLRTRNLPSHARYWFPDFSDRFGAGVIVATDLDRDDFDEVLIPYGHDYWPFYLVLHDLHRDEPRVVFIASGHHRVVGTQDLDGDGVEELIVDGIANRQGWYRAIAAIRVTLDRRPENAPATTPDRPDTTRSQALLWYALIPPGMEATVTIHPDRRIIRIEYEHRKAVELTFDGFAAGSASPLPAAERQRARRQAYAHLRDAVRWTDSKSPQAIVEAERARMFAARAGDATLTEWSERVEGVALVRLQRFDEADALFTRLAQRGTATELAWDAGNAFHLEGELPRAIAWYRRNLAEGLPGVGRMKYESIQGLVLALGEMGRWSEALAEIDHFEGAYVPESEWWDWYRRYVAWRTGRTSSADEHDLQVPFDVSRYWALEIALARNGDSGQLLRVVDADRARASETRSLLLVARAEALRRMGHLDDALAVAREALLALRNERRNSVLARAHFDLAAERLAALAEAKGLAGEARQARAEAAAVRWHPTGIAP